MNVEFISIPYTYNQGCEAGSESFGRIRVLEEGRKRIGFSKFGQIRITIVSEHKGLKSL